MFLSYNSDDRKRRGITILVIQGGNSTTIIRYLKLVQRPLGHS